jgi:deazaflavin-dependent oxidoreductase (nitroreductase family)
MIYKQITDPKVGNMNTSIARTPNRYIRPNVFTQRVFNPLVARLTRLGVSVWGSRVLEVRGRTSGAVRSTPVNVLTIDGERFLVAPRGTTEWVRNIRVAGEAELRIGRRAERIAVEELTDDVKPAVLRAYLRRWKWEVGQFFGGVDAGATEAQILAVAPGYPVFRLRPLPDAQKP